MILVLNFIPKPRKPEKELFPAGKHDLRLFGVVHLGGHKNKNYISDAFYFMFEAPKLEKKIFDESKGEQPQAIFRKVYGRKKYFELLEDLFDGERSFTKEEKDSGIDVRPLIGNLYRCKVTHDASKRDKDIIYANLSKIIELKKEGKEKDTENEVVLFSPSYNPDTKAEYKTAEEIVEDCEYFRKVPSWLQNEIKKSVDFRELPGSENYPPESAEG